MVREVHCISIVCVRDFMVNMSLSSVQRWRVGRGHGVGVEGGL